MSAICVQIPDMVPKRGTAGLNRIFLGQGFLAKSISEPPTCRFADYMQMAPNMQTQEGMNTFLLLAWIGCQSLDLGTTTYGLQHGLTEGNPLMRKAQIPIRIGVNLGAVIAYRRTKARALPAVLAISGCSAGTWNLAQIRRMQ